VTAPTKKVGVFLFLAMQILISTKEIIKKYGISYAQINYLTKKGVFKVIKKAGNKRLYDLEKIEKVVYGPHYR